MAELKWLALRPGGVVDRLPSSGYVASEFTFAASLQYHRCNMKKRWLGLLTISSASPPVGSTPSS